MANVVAAGDLQLIDDPAHAITEFAMLIQFETLEEFREAMKKGVVEFTFFGEPCSKEEV